VFDEKLKKVEIEEIKKRMKHQRESEKLENSPPGYPSHDYTFEDQLEE